MRSYRKKCHSPVDYAESSSIDSFYILVDSSNHGNQKFYPVCTYHSLFDVETGFAINTKLLLLVELQGETSQMLCSAVEAVISKYVVSCSPLCRQHQHKSRWITKAG